MRSFLTMLGIVIGVASVIILVSIVSGYMGSMVENFTSMGVNRINVRVTNTASRVLDPDEFYAFFDENRDLLEYMSPNVNSQLRPKYKGDTLNSTMVGGYSEDYLNIMGYEMEEGRNLSYADSAACSKVAVLGYYTAWYMFGSAEGALGEKLKMGGNSFTVVGVVKRQTEKDSDFKEGCTDDFVWIPYEVAAKYNRNRNISNYIITSRDVEDTDACTEAIENFLYTVYKNDDFYTVTANSTILDTMNEMIGTLSMMLGGIAGISLLVAGVGVMNIMLVSVTERTREIGIRKALGAKRSVIMQQFVIEAAVTSSIGGIMGIILGGLATGLIGQIIGINASPTLSAVLVSFGVSVSIGLIFGYMPAARAARLNPIDALRSE